MTIVLDSEGAFNIYHKNCVTKLGIYMLIYIYIYILDKIIRVSPIGEMRGVSPN